jgi:membrane protease YdiL (CAAX protease family)
MKQEAQAPFLKTALALWGLGLIGAALLVPYLSDLLATTLAQAAQRAHVPITTLLVAQLVQTVVLIGICVFLGLWAARTVGFTTPALSALLTGARPKGYGPAAAFSILAGAITGAAIIALDVKLFAPSLPAQFTAHAGPAAWKGLLASFYGGFVEEIMLRLFLLSVLALVLQALATGGKPRSRPLAPWIFWTANLASALAFGAGHLPAAAALAPLTGMLVTRTIVLNGLGGVVFGALYRRWGLEAAMLAHFSADLVLHVATPLAAGH